MFFVLQNLWVNCFQIGNFWWATVTLVKTVTEKTFVLILNRFFLCSLNSAACGVNGRSLQRILEGRLLLLKGHFMRLNGCQYTVSFCWLKLFVFVTFPQILSESNKSHLLLKFAALPPCGQVRYKYKKESRRLEDLWVVCWVFYWLNRLQKCKSDFKTFGPPTTNHILWVPLLRHPPHPVAPILHTNILARPNKLVWHQCLSTCQGKKKNKKSPLWYWRAGVRDTVAKFQPKRWFTRLRHVLETPAAYWHATVCVAIQ